MKSTEAADLHEQEVMMDEELEKERDEQINELVSNINKLTSIYKELNKMVIDQGSIIDRIDCNIDDTVTHIQKGVVHLRGAEKHASSATADKCIRILLLLVLIGAIALGYKYSASTPK
jgi:t-SNARE complex subunit (syntaxin)